MKTEIKPRPRATSKVGEAPPETPPGIVYIGAELIDDSASKLLQRGSA